MSNIRIYVIYHKLGFVPKQSMLVPIQVGADLAQQQYDGMLYDNVGQNISSKNNSYCELTAQYWAWQNENADYYGFFHYRRYLSFDLKSLVDYTMPQKKLPLAYKIYKLPDKATLDRLGYNVENINSIIKNFHVIAPLPEEMFISVYKQYKEACFQNISDLDLALEIIREKYPEFQDVMQEYVFGTKHYFGNIYIMKKEIFFNYCKWLFDIMEIFDGQTKSLKYSSRINRVNGYLGERLFGIYYTWLKKQPGIRWAELPRIHFEAFPGETNNFATMRRINVLFPPGTQRRAWIKKMVKIMKGRNR